MSDILAKAAEALSEKLTGDFDGSAKFVLEGVGAILISGSGVEVVDEGTEADVTMTADTDTFQGILDGSENPTAAFMSGKLSVDGDMGKAMSLATLLA